MALLTIMTVMVVTPKTAPTAMLTVVRGIGANERTITRVPTTMALMKLNSPHICRKCLRASDNDSITGRSVLLHVPRSFRWHFRYVQLGIIEQRELKRPANG